jgi:hypothetical protein
MKNNRVEKVVGIIIKEQKNLATHVAHLDSSEKRRALMSVAHFSASAGYDGVMREAIELLGFRDEEVLIFAMATIAGGRPQMVPRIIKRFCRNTAIARDVLGESARRIISWAERTEEPSYLHTAIDCVRLFKEKIGAAPKGTYSSPNQATIVAGFILWLAEDLLKAEPLTRETHDKIVAELHELVPDEACWERLQQSKGRLGGPRK